MNWLQWFRKEEKAFPQELQFYEKAMLGEESSDLVFFDCETTGLNTKKDQIVSIGALKLKGNGFKAKDVFYKEVNVETNGAVAVHEILANQSNESIKEVLKSFLRFVGNATLVGHHVAFDVAMVNKALQSTFKVALQNDTIDTAHLAIKKDHGGRIPDMYRRDRYAIDALCNRYNIEIKDRHHAMGDAYLTMQLYLKLT